MQLAPYIDTPRALEEMVEALRGQKVLAIDTEFIRETTFFPKIALIQVATRDRAWLVDPLALDAAALEPFLQILWDPNVLKVMHAAFADQECFYWSYGKVATPVLDTAVAAALSGYGDNVGLAKLTKDVLRIHLHKGRSRVRWLQRPLSKELLQYAQQDVDTLVELAYRMRDRLESKGRWQWALEQSEVDPKDFDTPPEDIAHRLAKSGHLDEVTYLALLELVRWREERARRANLPRAWVAENEVLVALAKARPRSVQELRAFRGIGPKEIDRSGEIILDAIERGERLPRSQANLPVRNLETAEVDSLALDLLKAYLSFLSSRYEIAPRFLLRTGRNAELILYAQQDPREWVERGILSPQASAVIGRDLQDFVRGGLKLGLKDGRVEISRVR